MSLKIREKVQVCAENQNSFKTIHWLVLTPFLAYLNTEAEGFCLF